MRRELFIHRSRGEHKRNAGFSLVEMLVTLLITSVMLVPLTAFFRVNLETRHDMDNRVEVQQGLRGLMEIMSHALRQAGICLPPLGQFIALDGSNNGQRDSLTVRIGRVANTSLLCIRAGTTAAAPAGATTLQVGPGEGNLFAGVTSAYVTSNAATGKFYQVISHTANTITLGNGLDVAHPAGAGIYAVDVYSYAVTTDDNGRYMLTVAGSDGVAQPLATGVEQLNLEYLVCGTTCSYTNWPANQSEWRQVREVRLTATVRSRLANKNGQYATETGRTIIRPRSLS